jgi:hypothetical protein
MTFASKFFNNNNYSTAVLFRSHCHLQAFQKNPGDGLHLARHSVLGPDCASSAEALLTGTATTNDGKREAVQKYIEFQLRTLLELKFSDTYCLLADGLASDTACGRSVSMQYTNWLTFSEAEEIEMVGWPEDVVFQRPSGLRRAGEIDKVYQACVDGRLCIKKRV